MSRRATAMRSEVGFRHTPGFGAISVVRPGARRGGPGVFTVLAALAGLAGLILVGLGAYAERLG